MTQEKQRFKWQKMSGDTVTVGDLSVTPQSRSLAIRWPRGGWVWNRPVAILVERGEEKERIPIVDVTRIARLGLYGLSLVMAVVGLAMWIKERSASDE
jgi:hypothetical protein